MTPITDPAVIAAAAASDAPAPVETPAPVVEPAPTPGPAPWARSLETRFEDPAVRAQVDAYLREEQQPYITGLEERRAAAEGKSWVFDRLSEDPEAALKEIVAAVWDDEAAERVHQLVTEGWTPAEAAAQAGEEAEAAGVVATPAELPAEVKETVEWAKNERARQAADAAAKAEAEALEAAKVELNEWASPLLEKEPDIKRSTLMAYVAASGGDMDGGYRAYRADFPAPAKPEAPAGIGGRASAGGPAPRRMTLDEAAGAVFDAARGARPSN